MEQANYTIIVAEDEALLLEYLVDKIHQLDIGFEIIGKAQTGSQAYELVKQLTPDVLITDIRMPVMDGIALLEKVHIRFPMTKFIIISGFSEFEYAKSAIRLQVSEYLLKPIDPEELKNALMALKRQFEIEQSTYAEIFNPAMTRNNPEHIAGVLKDYLIHNYKTDINLNLIAKNMNFSPSYLTKIFFQQYETTPSKFLTSLRISKAKHYLTHHQELTIRQIGEIVGYHDQGYFSRIFKKQTGTSPFEYRKVK